MAGSRPEAAIAAPFIAVSLAALAYVILRELRSVRRESRELWRLSGVITEGRLWPSLGEWALDASALSVVIRLLQGRPDVTVVELGPGASSVVLGRALVSARLYGLEHDSQFAAALRDDLRIHGLEGRYELIDAPLEDRPSQAGTSRWYAASSLERLPPRIDLLVIDGPPEWNNRGGRSHALEALRDRLVPGSLLLVDDTLRESERQMVEQWVESGGLVVVRDEHSYVLLRVR